MGLIKPRRYSPTYSSSCTFVTYFFADLVLRKREWVSDRRPLDSVDFWDDTNTGNVFQEVVISNKIDGGSRKTPTKETETSPNRMW